MPSTTILDSSVVFSVCGRRLQNCVCVICVRTAEIAIEFSFPQHATFFVITAIVAGASAKSPPSFSICVCVCSVRLESGRPSAMGDNEQKAMALMAEAEKKMTSPKGFFGSLFGCV